LTDILQMCLAE